MRGSDDYEILDGSDVFWCYHSAAPKYFIGDEDVAILNPHSGFHWIFVASLYQRREASGSIFVAFFVREDLVGLS